MEEIQMIIHILLDKMYLYYISKYICFHFWVVRVVHNDFKQIYWRRKT